MVIGKGNIASESMLNIEEVVMENYIGTPKISEILSKEFMIPFGLSAYKPAREIQIIFVPL